MIALRLPPLEDARVRLRAFRDDDLALVRAASSDPLIPLITSVPTNDSEADALAFIARQHDRLATGAGYSFAVADATTDAAVGQIGLWPRAVDPERASVGYWVAADFRGSGYATTALGLLSEWALSAGRFERLELAVEPWNEASWRLAELTGFKREGLMRRWQRVGDERKDMFLYARLRSDVGNARR